MRLRSLESRIVAFFLLLILVVQLSGFFAIRMGIDANARVLIQNEISIGERVFKRLLEQNAQKLIQGARLLASDYGFLQAIGTEDIETITSALSNHGSRIGASTSVLINANHKIKAVTSTTASPSLEKSIQVLINHAELTGTANDVVIIDNLPYQMVVVPVKAPILMGWVAMTFPIDQRIVTDMHDLSSLQISVITKSMNSNWTSRASTLTENEIKGLTDFLNGARADLESIRAFKINESEYSIGIRKLTQDNEQPAIVVLQRSINDAIAPYRRLQFTLLVLTALGIALAVSGSILTAKRITDPLKQLADKAKRLGAGEYQENIEIKRKDEIGELSKAFANMQEGIVKREIEIKRLAYWDTLTNLPNRAQFVNLLDQAILQAKEKNESCYILMMDLDRFKNVNDVLGHSFGDALLGQVAERLKLQLVGATDQIARLGGDEFAILLPKVHISDALAVANRILKSLEAPISLQDQVVDLGAGIGIAGYPEHGSDAQSILSRAEVAMYAAKTSGNVAVIYDSTIDKTNQKNLSLLSELRHAVEHNELRLQVQPKVKLSTGEILGIESLVRWQHPEKGMIFPDHFIPFAEKTGFIRALTHWVLDKSAALCRECDERGIFLKVSVNLSTRDLMDPDLPAKFAEILARHKVRPTSFCLEITESAIMDDPVRAQQTLERLHAMNVALSIDDFGTGYSSLAYLKRLPVHELKIDRSFVMGMERDEEDTKIVQSTIDLGHNMGLTVVAEGIENIAVWELLMKMGCDEGQGYFISKPMPADQLIPWIEKWVTPKLMSQSSLL